MKRIFIILSTIILSTLCFVGCSSGYTTTSNRGSSNSGTTKSVNYYATNSDNVSLRVTKIQNTKQVGGSYFGDSTNYNFVILDVTITNNGSSEVEIYNSNFSLYNSRNVKYSSTTSLYIDSIMWETIGVGLSKSFQVMFETPNTTEAELYTLACEYSYLSSKTIRITLG